MRKKTINFNFKDPQAVNSQISGIQRYNTFYRTKRMPKTQL